MNNSEDTVHIQSGELRGFCLKLLEKMELDEESARCLVDSLIEANLRGCDTHGVVRLPTYIDRFRTIEWRPPSVLEDSVAIGVVDGHDGMGQICATKAMELAIEKAEELGVGVVGVRNSNHFGAAAHYGMMAAARGMIGFAFTNASPRIAPWGGKEPLLGTNPLCVAFPTDREYPVVVDMSNSVVPAGRIRTSARKGEPIPEGWALDRNGRPTRDPEEALKGLLLPIAGHKGYCLTLMVDILSGVMTGSGFARDIRGIREIDTAQRVGHLLGAVDIRRFMPFDVFLERMGTLIDRVKSCETLEGTDEVFLPGEIEYRTSQERSEHGIPLQRKVIGSLNQVAEQLGVATRLAA